MVHCTQTGCGWQSIAPSEPAAQRQYAEHLVEEHTEDVDREIPAGMVEVRLGEDDEWRTMTVEQAKAFHDAVHGYDE
jgi:predicted small metal-binding protein